MAAFTEEQVKDFSIKNWYDLSGQVAVVTGGATGLGLAITRCLVSAGAQHQRHGPQYKKHTFFHHIYLSLYTVLQHQSICQKGTVFPNQLYLKAFSV